MQRIGRDALYKGLLFPDSKCLMGMKLEIYKKDTLPGAGIYMIFHVGMVRPVNDK